MHSGSEATNHAIRLVRGVTGREKIPQFRAEQRLHDYVLRNVPSVPSWSAGATRSPRTLDVAIDATLVACFNDLDDVEAVLAEHREQVAAIIVERWRRPARAGPAGGFLEGLRDLCDREGALLDLRRGHHRPSAITLARDQAIAGVLLTMTTLGKAIANGFLIAAIAGPRELMERYTYDRRATCTSAVPSTATRWRWRWCCARIQELEDGEAHGCVVALGERMRDGCAPLRPRGRAVAGGPPGRCRVGVHGRPARVLRRRAAGRERASSAPPARALSRAAVRDAQEPRRSDISVLAPRTTSTDSPAAARKRWRRRSTPAPRPRGVADPRSTNGSGAHAGRIRIAWTPLIRARGRGRCRARTGDPSVALEPRTVKVSRRQAAQRDRQRGLRPPG